ncbi:unnamed protein product, partial [Allacma fusca]
METNGTGNADNGQRGNGDMTIHDMYAKLLEHQIGIKADLHKRCEVLETNSNTVVRRLEENTAALMKRINDVETEQKRLNDEQRKLNAEQGKIKEDLNVHIHEVQGAISNMDNVMVRKIRDEIFEMDRRKSKLNNFLIMGVEQKSEEEDRKYVLELVGKICPGKSIGVKTQRIGESGTFRPILVSTEKVRDKRRVIDASRKGLGNFPEFSRIYIKPDLTVKQREELGRKRAIKSGTTSPAEPKNDTPYRTPAVVGKRKLAFRIPAKAKHPKLKP